MDTKGLKEYLLDNVEETQLLELLDLTVEELVEAFSDRIVDRYDYLMSKLEIDNAPIHTDSDLHNSSD